MVSRQIFDETMMSVAYDISNMSRATRKKVGAIIVQGRNIISFGFNGTPIGFNNTCEDFFDRTLPEVIHAESNAILKVATSNYNTEGAKMYCTLSPCFDCSKLIIQARISEIIYREEYHNTAGLELLSRAGLIVRKL